MRFATVACSHSSMKVQSFWLKVSPSHQWMSIPFGATATASHVIEAVRSGMQMKWDCPKYSPEFRDWLVSLANAIGKLRHCY